MNLIRSLESPGKIAGLLTLVQSVCDSGQYTEGVMTAKFEKMVSELHPKSDQAIAMSNAGAGLFSVCVALKKLLGTQRIAVQNNTFYATGAMAHEAGLLVFLTDNRKDDPSMSIDSLVKLYEEVPSLDAVMLTHVGGTLAKDYEAIAGFCADKGLVLFEDAAHAFGTVENGVRAGDYSLGAVYSFYPTKAVPIGEGGMVVTNDDDLAQELRAFRSYGKYKDANGVIRYQRGFNLRMDEWSAAVGVLQMKYLEEVLAARLRDAVRLGMLMLPLTDRPSNWYKYPVKKQPGWKTVGPVYQRSDQLDSILPYVTAPVPLTHSRRWAEAHMCLPLGEGIYDDMTNDDIRKFLEVA